MHAELALKPFKAAHGGGALAVFFQMIRAIGIFNDEGHGQIRAEFFIHTDGAGTGAAAAVRS